MRFAYADPPYPGKARKYYGDHPDFAGEVDHAALIARLEDEYDAWALSTDMASLREILPLCPAPEPRGAVGGGVRHQFRILSWCKPQAQFPSRGGPFYGWEPVILRGGRRVATSARDWLVVSSEARSRGHEPGWVTGAKPAAFTRWLIECAGLDPADEFHDLFPGSGAVAAEWERWRSQLRFAEDLRGGSAAAGGRQLEIA